MSDASATDRARGLLLGLAAGDRNGGPIRMALELAESLIEHRRYSGPDVFHRYLTWYQAEGFDTGPIARQVFTEALRGVPQPEAVLSAHERAGHLSAGCNPAHRAGPLAAAIGVTDEDLPRAAQAEAALTHYDPLAGEVCAGLVLACRALIRGVPWELALAKARRGRDHEVALALKPQRNVTLDSGGYAPAVLRAAVWFVSESRWPAEAVKASIDFAGPENYAPVIVGALSGARWGASGIEDTMLRHLGELRPRVEAAAERLAVDWS
ncbi:MAG: ADP-ribosylglycohydrolase family protein [Alphaproteobacteria bacterium]|nr:ADP-ribosylglycohydrolase family protein [Alphaproteobacteria bacterium]